MTLKNIFDTHCHYDDPAFDADREALLGSLFSSGLAGAVHASTDVKSAEFGIENAKKFPNFYTSVGVHPENLESASEDDLDRLRSLAAKNKKVVAVGEIGLDYHYDGFDRERQIFWFREQVKLANALGLPVIVHSRDASQDTLDVLKELRPMGILHCFSGSWETAKEVLRLGLYIGFTGALTFKNARKAVEVAQNMPADRILFETDCPYMAPEPFRGRRSDSSMIPYVIERAAAIRGMDADELAAMSVENAKRVFGVGED